MEEKGSNWDQKSIKIEVYQLSPTYPLLVPKQDINQKAQEIDAPQSTNLSLDK